MTRIAVILLAMMMLFSCAEESELEIEQIQIVTKDPQQLSHWYTTNFGFQSLENELSYNDFKIRLKKNEEASNLNAIKEAFHLKEVPGFFKIGFVTNQYDNLQETLQKNKVEFVGGELYDDKINRRSFMVKDPDGNFIQIFEGSGRDRLKPYCIGVIVESIGEQEKWYQMKLPVNKTHVLDLPDQNIFKRLLEGDNFLIELINTSNQTVKKELDKHERLGISSIKVRGAGAQFDKDHEGNLIVHE